jgi:dTDP-4-dehydrorhamnose 3,5-epimerase-like enzyme
MKQSGNGIPVVQTAGTWREAVRGYVMKPQSSKTRTVVMVLLGMVVAAAVDYRLFDQSLFSAVAGVIR